MALKFSIILILALWLNQSFPPTREVKVINLESLEKIIHDPSPGTRVINFWATWCKPCIEELQYFEALRDNPAFNDVEIFLISLDFASDLDTRVIRFVENKDIQSTVLLLDNTDYDSWIDQVDPSWSGAIPATLMINGQTGKRAFFEKQFELGELEEKLSNFIDQAKP
jgi:thiol-disulfide isomerase/thioredoxin